MKQRLLCIFQQRVFFLIVLLSVVLSFSAKAEVEIDKVYHPYVQPFERELEVRSFYTKDNQDELDGNQKYQFAAGLSLTESFNLETYVIGQKLSGEGFKIVSFEIEGQLQLTEQGEYWSDWGLLIELESEREEKVWGIAAGLLWEKEFGSWATTANLFVDYSFGSDINDKLESAFRGQLRYRWMPQFEPAVELYLGDEANGMGPVLLGSQRFGRQKLKWELGVIFGLDNETPDQTLRALVELEF